jgi:hypothetical protein
MYMCAQVGLDKLAFTQGVVATLREELTVLRPQLTITMEEASSNSNTNNPITIQSFSQATVYMSLECASLCQ